MDDYKCPICFELLICPVTLPCSHELCLSCYQHHTQEVSLSCPICRHRIQVWSRSAALLNSLVNQDRWKMIKDRFPDEVKRLMSTADDNDLEDISANRPPISFPPQPLAQRGEIRMEFEAQLRAHLAEWAARQKQEEDASMRLIERIQSEGNMPSTSTGLYHEEDIPTRSYVPSSAAHASPWQSSLAFREFTPDDKYKMNLARLSSCQNGGAKQDTSDVFNIADAVTEGQRRRQFYREKAVMMGARSHSAERDCSPSTSGVVWTSTAVRNKRSDSTNPMMDRLTLEHSSSVGRNLSDYPMTQLTQDDEIKFVETITNANRKKRPTVVEAKVESIETPSDLNLQLSQTQDSINESSHCTFEPIEPAVKTPPKLQQTGHLETTNAYFSPIRLPQPAMAISAVPVESVDEASDSGRSTKSKDIHSPRVYRMVKRSKRKGTKRQFGVGGHAKPVDKAIIIRSPDNHDDVKRDVVQDFTSNLHNTIKCRQSIHNEQNFELSQPKMKDKINRSSRNYTEVRLFRRGDSGASITSRSNASTSLKRSIQLANKLKRRAMSSSSSRSPSPLKTRNQRFADSYIPSPYVGPVGTRRTTVDRTVVKDIPPSEMEPVIATTNSSPSDMSPVKPTPSSSRPKRSSRKTQSLDDDSLMKTPSSSVPDAAPIEGTNKRSMRSQKKHNSFLASHEVAAKSAAANSSVSPVKVEPVIPVTPVPTKKVTPTSAQSTRSRSTGKKRKLSRRSTSKKSKKRRGSEVTRNASASSAVDLDPDFLFAMKLQKSLNREEREAQKPDRSSKSPGAYLIRSRVKLEKE